MGAQMSKKTITKPRLRKRTKSEGGDTIKIQHVGAGAVVAAGRGAKAASISNGNLSPTEKWVEQINAKIDALSKLPQSEKDDLRDQVEKIGDEMQRGSKAEMSRLEKLINTLTVMAPDIFDVVVATLQSPLAGAGMVIKKIGDKVKLEKVGNP